MTDHSSCYLGLVDPGNNLNGHPVLLFTWKTTSGLLMQSMQMPEMTLVRKKGSQQMMNTPITVPSVLAAFFSFANLVTLQWNRGRDSTFRFWSMWSTGWHIRLFSRFCWHQRRSCVLIQGAHTKTDYNSTLFKCQLNLGNNPMCHPVLFHKAHRWSRNTFGLGRGLLNVRWSWC